MVIYPHMFYSSVGIVFALVLFIYFVLFANSELNRCN